MKPSVAPVRASWSRASVCEICLNPSRASPSSKTRNIPAPCRILQDPDGSAVDAQILARYVWLAASRFDEYKNALCLCVADALPAIYAVAPAGRNLFSESQPVTVERIGQIVREWMS